LPPLQTEARTIKTNHRLKTVFLLAIPAGQALKSKSSENNALPNWAALHRKKMQSSQFSKAGRRCFLPSQSGFTGRARFAGFLNNLVFRFFYQCREVRADAVSDAKREFQCRIAETPLNEAQHGFGNTRALRDRIIGKFPALSLLLQESDDFITNGFVVADSRHNEVWQGKRFDIYFAIVKYWALG
jgi:hypothetical protein